jgi:hypothetical protein
MRLTIQSATIERTYRNAQASTRRVTLNGRADGRGFAIGDTLPEGHFWSGWKITAIVECGVLHK